MNEQELVKFENKLIKLNFYRHQRHYNGMEWRMKLGCQTWIVAIFEGKDGYIGFSSLHDCFTTKTFKEVTDILLFRIKMILIGFDNSTI